MNEIESMGRLGFALLIIISVDACDQLTEDFGLTLRIQITG
jgi:hypothetical protein